METKKKHSEEVAELNQQIDFVFGTLPSLLQNSTQDAIDQLLVLEKKSRLMLEPSITIRITDKILDICFESENIVKLNSSIVLLSKRRSQHDDVIAALVRKGMSFLNQINDYDTKMSLIQTLMDTSEGKIFLEADRAYLIRELMRMKESKGDIQGAALASQEIQVEVCNALSSRDKAEFLLEQIRLCQAVGDWVRVPLTIQKVNVKVLKEEGYEELIESYIQLCIIQHLHDKNYLSLYYDYERYLTLTKYEENDTLALHVVEILCLLCVLMPYGDEQQLLLRSITDKYKRFWKYTENYRGFISLFVQHQLIEWPLDMINTIQNNELFTYDMTDDVTNRKENWMELLRKQVIEHNIRVLGECVTESSIGRVAELLQVDEKTAEEALASACVEGMTWLRMDRVQRTVCFQQPRAAETVLTDWTGEVKDVMEGLDRIVYLIEKEKMMKEIQ